MASPYGSFPFGYGPYAPFGGVVLPPAIPPSGGYGGYSYGTSSYGALGSYGRPIIPVSGGYGGYPYGTSPYGSIDSLSGPPAVLSAVSVTGFQIEVFFSQEMTPDAALFDPASYTLVDVSGAAPSVVQSVQVGVMGTLGPTSVLLNHTGTTLGGLYTVIVVGPKDIGGTAIAAYAPLNQADVLCKGEPPPYTVTPESGTELRLDFDQDMLPESGFTPGILQTDAYAFETTYPQTILTQMVTHPYNGSDAQVKLDVQGMTSASYTSVISPATAIEYDGSYLPNDPIADFTGIEVGTGSSTISGSELLLTKSIGFSYGWQFLDDSGRLVPNSSYRVDVTFDVSPATIAPAIGTDALIQITVSDGAVEIQLALTRVAGIDTVEVDSGVFSASSPIDWSSQPTTVSLVRNQKADTYTVVVNGMPLLSDATASFTGAPSLPSAGVEFLLDPAMVYDVTDLPLQAVGFTATQTVFSAAWNFLHNHLSLFSGSAAAAKTTLLTAKGPLVKGWGDATPATKADVTVYVNGTPVDIMSVNPYYGSIELAIPIPCMPPGAMTVEVDYIWFPAPDMEMAGLNTLGLVLNKVSCRPLCASGTSSSGVGLPGGGTNGIQFSRFPMGVVLGPSTPNTAQPLLRSPRYQAFDKKYTAALNSPTTLLLNRNPHQVALTGESRTREGESVFYEGTESPINSDPAWNLVGIDGIETFPDEEFPPGFGDSLPGVFQVYKDISGPFGTGDVSFYERPIDVSGPETIVVVSRMQGRSDGENFDGDSLPIYDGVFSGIGFGCHTDNHLYLVGCLEVNGVQHVGMLVEPAYPELVSSWALAFETSIEITDATTFKVSSDSLPRLVRDRLLSDEIVRLQILEGTQSGVYTLQDVIDFPDGTSEVSLVSGEAFPADPGLFGNRDATAFFEQVWEGSGALGDFVTYRLIVMQDIKAKPEGFAQLFVGGSLSGAALTLEGAPAFAIPPDGVLLYPTGDNGSVFWGSLDRRASNLSDWTFFRYGIEPASSAEHVRQIVAAAEMNDLPEEDPNNIWFLTQEFGSRMIDATGDQLLLKATSSNLETGVEGQDLTIGYERLEPFLNRKLAIDVDTTFQVDSGTLGAGDLRFQIEDSLKQVLLTTLLYTEGSDRQLLQLDSISLSGLLLPDQQSFVKSGSLTQERVQGQRIQYVQASGETLLYAQNLVEVGASPAGDGRVCELRALVSSVTTTDPDGDTGLFFGGDVGPVAASRGVGLQLRVASGGTPSQVFLFSLETGVEVAAYDVDWNDGNLHTYRVICDADTFTVSVIVDDVVLGVADLLLFAVSSTETEATLGFASSVTAMDAEVEDFSVVSLPPISAKRTLGVYLGGDADSIDSYKIPRTDTLAVPNSDLAAVVEEMDWRTRMRVRIHRDPSWGVTILRPDLPPPPYFTGNFATQFTQPSAGWINVEYRDLPLSSRTSGSVSFGSFDPRSVTQSRIDEVRYRIYRYASEDIIMPHHMVLNQQNVLTSGEFYKDKTVHVSNVVSTNSTTIPLTSLNVYVERVFGITYVDVLGNTVELFPGSFELDQETQTITITSAHTLGFFPSADEPVLPEDTVSNPSLNESEIWPYPIGFDPLSPVAFGEPLDASNYFADVQQEVTVSYAVGKPLTLTYLCNQPLLDGCTLLNEGTPPYQKGLVGKDSGMLAWGSRINDPNDLLNTDPDFILNDPFRFLDFQPDPKVVYEDIEFCEVSDGEECRLTPFCDDSVPGAAEAGAPGNEPGDIGNGLIDVGLSGASFTETEAITFSDGPAGPYGAVSAKVFLETSGGDEDMGGNLNESLLFTPLGPASPTAPEGGNVGWSVFGQLYDLATNTVTNLYFDSGKPVP